MHKYKIFASNSKHIISGVILEIILTESTLSSETIENKLFKNIESTKLLCTWKIKFPNNVIRYDIVDMHNGDILTIDFFPKTKQTPISKMRIKATNNVSSNTIERLFTNIQTHLDPKATIKP